MPILYLTNPELRLTIAPDSGFRRHLGIAGIHPAVDWPERAEIAAHFGLGMDQADYNLFVLGEVGSGRSSLLKQAMQTGAALRATLPDLCYLHNFDALEHPHALRLPAGQGRLFRMARMVKALLTEIPQHLDGPTSKVESERLENPTRRKRPWARRT